MCSLPDKHLLMFGSLLDISIELAMVYSMLFIAWLRSGPFDLRAL